MEETVLEWSECVGRSGERGHPEYQENIASWVLGFAPFLRSQTKQSTEPLHPRRVPTNHTLAVHAVDKCTRGRPHQIQQMTTC